MQRMVIKGSEWHRGNKVREWGLSLLLTPEGRRCCIGIHARLCGIPDDDILECGDVEAMESEDLTECYLPWVDDESENSPMAINAMGINDDKMTTDEQKIAALRPIFAEIDVDIVWRPEL